LREKFNHGKYAVLLNGVLGQQFHYKRGVRHGDPPSPLLFVLAADVLQFAINKAYMNRLLTAPFSPDFIWITQLCSMQMTLL
jgi:hypothetical protein